MELKITRKEPGCALTVGLSFYDIFSHSNKNSTSFYLRPNKNISKKIQVETELHPPKEIISAKAKNKFLLSFYRQNDKIILYSKKPETLNIDR